MIVSGLVEDIKSPTFKNLRIFTPQVLNLQFMDTLAQIKGDIFVNGEYLNPEIVGQIFIQNLYNQPTQLSVSNCSIDFNKNIASVNK